MTRDRETVEAYSRYAEQWAQRKKTGSNPAHEYLTPQMVTLLPNLTGKRILCIGSGAGEECELIQEMGASMVVGVDAALGLVNFAKRQYPNQEFAVMDMEHLGVRPVSFDIVYSNLTFHYTDNWTKLLADIHQSLKPGGDLFFSTHHPVKWGADYRKTDEESHHILGYKKNKTEGTVEVYGDYLNPRLVEDTWFGDFKVRYYHRSLEAIMQDILRSGFRLINFLEPKPIDEAKEKDPTFWEIHQKIPTFLIFHLLKE